MIRSLINYSTKSIHDITVLIKIYISMIFTPHWSQLAMQHMHETSLNTKSTPRSQRCWPIPQSSTVLYSLPDSAKAFIWNTKSSMAQTV